MNKFKRLRISTFFSILFQGAQALASLIIAMVALGSGSIVVGYIRNVFSFIIIGLLIVVISGVALISLYTLALEKIRAKPSSFTYPSFAGKKPAVKILLKEIVYQYFPDGQTMSQRKRFKLRALEDGIASFPDRYRWTGTGKCIVKSLTPGFKVVNKHKEEFWDYFDIRFPHPLRKGEEVEFIIEWDLFDEGKTMVPFLSTMIDFPTEHLLMRVVFPPNLAPKRAYCHDYANYIDNLPIATSERRWDPTTQAVSYEVSRPQKYHKYLIRWYSNDKGS